MAEAFNTVRFTIFLYIVVVSNINAEQHTSHFEAQEKLITKLVKNSNIRKEILPMANSSAPVRLRVNVGIRQIATVDEVNQALRLNVWLRLYWNNPYLTWNPADYGNITNVHLDNALLWTPDISMYNKASLEEEIDILYKRLSTSVVLDHKGNCAWLSPATLLSQCKINVREFPFDEQNCELIFGSWTYSALKVDVHSAGADIIDFLPNGEWDVLGYPVKRFVKHYSKIPYAEVRLTLRIKRQPLYYTLNLILPCTVIATLAFLSFALPSNHGERISLVITVLLAMSVYMLIVSSTLPQTSDAMPVIGTYFLCIIVETALCLLATCFVAKIRDHECEIPKWLDRLVNKRLARLLFMSNTIEGYDAVPKLVNMKMNGHQKPVDISLNEVKLSEDMKTERSNYNTMQKLCDELGVLTNDVSKRQKREGRQLKWQNVARVLDRFFLIFFPLIFVIITAAVFA